MPLRGHGRGGRPDISVLEDYVPNLAVYAGRNQSTTLTAFLRSITRPT
jgi:hypothetical protein